MSNDLVARLRWYVTNVSSINSPLVPALQKIIAEAADALSQTIPRTTDEGMREILAEEMRKKCGLPCPSADYLARGDFRFISVSGATLAEIALAAMRRVSKTDEGRNAAAGEMVEVGQGVTIMAADDLIHANPYDKPADALSQTIPRTTDEGMREILAEECKTAGAWMAAADLRNNHSCDVPHNAALSAMRRVSKTDEGRNAVWQPIETAPKDGTRVLLLLKDPIPEARDDLRRWDGIPFVGCNHGNISEWQFAAPVGHGGFPDEWMVGWQPISPTHNR